MTSIADSTPLLEGVQDADSEQSERQLSYADEDVRYRTLAVAWVATATVVRFLCVATLPLGNGEAYYYSWSRFLDWSYYDHPPLVAWMVRATTLFGASPATVRLGPVLAAGLFGLLFHRLAARLVRPRAAFFALILVTAIPVFLASSFILNPEAPLAPLWVGFLLVIEAMREKNNRYLPLLAGVLLGVAFLAKYTAVLLVPTVFLYLIASPPMRRWLRQPTLYVGGAIALAIASPVILWNQARGWPSLHLHLVERASAVQVAGENTINQLVQIASSSGGSGFIEGLSRVVVGQVMSYSPLLAPLLILGLVRVLRGSRTNDNDRFLAAFSWPILVLLLIVMTQLKDSEQHWTMVAFIPAAIAAGRIVDAAWSKRRSEGLPSTARGVRLLATLGVGLSGLLFVVGNIHARTTALLHLIPEGHYDPRADMINELNGWDQIRTSLTQAATAAAAPGGGPAAQALVPAAYELSRDGTGSGTGTTHASSPASKIPGNVVLASNHYALCARMFFELGDDPPVYCPTARRSAFDFFARRDPPEGATVIALTTDIHPELPEGLAGRSCPVSDQVDIMRGGRRVARYYVRSCAPVGSDSTLRASRE